MHKFNVTKLEKLNNPERVNMIDIDKILTELELPTNPNIVDIGAGTGVFSAEILNKVDGGRAYALDISEEMINWIKENRSEWKDGKIVAKLMKESEIPLDDKIADLVFMITVHHELENPTSLLKDIKRVLKPNGKVLICDWKEGAHKHFVLKAQILDQLKEAGFNQCIEVEASEKLVCIIAR